MTSLRHANLDGVYDTHTNVMFYPKIMQPTHARWEQILPLTSPAQAEPKQLTNGLTNGHLTNGTTDNHDDNVMDVERLHRSPDQQPQQSSIFSSVPAIISRNFTIIDSVFEAPPLSHTGYPGPAGDIADLASGPNGLSTVPDDLLDELPEDCRRAFEQTRTTEGQWKRSWGTEVESGLRGNLKVGFNGYPV